MGHQKCPKTDCWICFQQGMDFFGIGRDLQFGVRQPWWVMFKSHAERKGRTLFIEGKRNWKGYGKKESMAFHWLSLCLERKVFLPVIMLCYGHRVWELPLSGLPALIKVSLFYRLCVYCTKKQIIIWHVFFCDKILSLKICAFKTQPCFHM